MNLAKIFQDEMATKSPKDGKELLLLVFDEISNLWNLYDGTLYFALRRVLGMLKETPIWSFFLSTQSSTAHFVPTKEVEISERIILEELTILPPFLALQLDVNALQAVKQDFNAELKKPMSKF